MTDHYVIIGAGINGLVAANYLRRAGHAVTILERADRVGGACVSSETTIDGKSQRYALGASVLGLMPDFIFDETGLRGRLRTYVPDQSKCIYFADDAKSAWIHRDPGQLQTELARCWGERGDVEGFRRDEAAVVAFLQDGYRRAVVPTMDEACARLGETIATRWISGSAAELLDHYFTSEQTKIYMGMTVTESGPVSMHEPYSAFTIPLMDSGSVFDGYYGFVADGLWRLTETLGDIDRELGVDIRLGATVRHVDTHARAVEYEQLGQTRGVRYDQLVLATDPLTAARLVGDDGMVRTVESKRMLGTSGKLTLMFREPVRWRDDDAAAVASARDTAFRFIFSVDSLAAFERATLRVVDGDVDYEPGYIQIYCEGAAMRQLGLRESFDRLTLFFKNVSLGETGDALPHVRAAVERQLFARIANPEACVWGRMLAPRDLQRLFAFPGGNLDHTMLVGGQQLFDRQFAGDPLQHFFAFGQLQNVSYCGSASYPCGSIAGTPGYLCAMELMRGLAA